MEIVWISIENMVFVRKIVEIDQLFDIAMPLWGG
jgi:hypothetical protein